MVAHYYMQLQRKENQEAKEYNILFNDGSIKFVRKDKLNELKWK